MVWNRKDLSEKFIYYDDRILTVRIPFAPLPSQVELLRGSILDFSCSIVSVDDHGDATAKSQLEEGASSWRKPGIDTTVRYAYEVQEDAKHIHQGGYPETKWAQFFRKWFFEPLEDATSKSSGGVRNVSRCNYYYDGFKTAGDSESWTTFDGRKQLNDTSPLLNFEREKCPKPDYACFLPIYRFDADRNIPKAHISEGRNWHQSPNHSIVEQFSWTQLKELHQYGLRSTPFKVFHAEPKESSLKCFPWLVVEHKKEPSAYEHRVQETVYCQAANAAACAVQLNFQVAKYALKSADYAHIPPIPVITTVGPKVKVWIMYYARDFKGPIENELWNDEAVMQNCKEGYMMKAIWEGDITNVEHAAKFQIILENTHTWAMRVFRPLISSYIDAWKCVHLGNSHGPSNAPMRRDEMIHHYQTSMPKILEFLDNLEAINLGKLAREDSSPLLLGMLFQMIHKQERTSLVEELTGIINEKMKRLDLALEARSSSSQPTPANRGQRGDVGEDQPEDSSQSTKSGDDDPTDLDYVDSQTPQDTQSSRATSVQSPFRADHNTPITTLRTPLSGASTQETQASKNETRLDTTRPSSTPMFFRSSLFPSIEKTPTPTASTGRLRHDTESTVSSQPASTPKTQNSQTSRLRNYQSIFNPLGLESKATGWLNATSPTPSKDRSHVPPEILRLGAASARPFASSTESQENLVPRVGLGTPLFGSQEMSTLPQPYEPMSIPSVLDFDFTSFPSKPSDHFGKSSIFSSGKMYTSRSAEETSKSGTRRKVQAESDEET